MPVANDQLEFCAEIRVSKQKALALRTKGYLGPSTKITSRYRVRYREYLSRSTTTYKIIFSENPERTPKEPPTEKKRIAIAPNLLTAIERMMELLKLPPGWNSYNAKPIEMENVKLAANILSLVMSHGTPVPHVVPLVRGGVQLEWHTRGINLEIEISSPEQVSFYAEDTRSGEPAIERPLDMAELSIWIRRLSGN